MAIPYPCPICSGTGVVDETASTVLACEVCHACNGKGIVWEPFEPYVVREAVFRYDVHAS